MITKDDWNAALDSWVAAERERLGGPPSPAEIVAYLHGELPRAEAERVQELLVYYPELAAGRDVRPLRARRPRSLRYLPIAATAALLLFVIPELRRAEAPFVIASKHELHAIHARGRDFVPPYELSLDEDRAVIEAFLSEPPHDPAYRVVISEHGKRLWTSAEVQPTRDGSIEIALPRGFLHPGDYQLEIYGVDRNGSFLRNTFAIRATH